MAIIPLQTARVSNLLSTSLTTQSLTQTQRQLLDVQNQLSTGKRLNSPSDDPSDAAVVIQLQKTLEQRKAYANNISQAQSQLGVVDTTLGDLNDLLTQAQNIASANVGSDVTATERAGAAAIVDELYKQAVTLGNKEFNGTYIFGGSLATDPPFVATPGGVKFVGSEQVLENRVDEDTDTPFMVNGAAVFGALSSQVRGSVDLTPKLSLQTRIADLRGARGEEVHLASITVGNGTTTKPVNLTNADTIGDVVEAINAAGVGGVTASVGPSGGLNLAGTGTDNITVADVGTGTTAADLGILRNTGAGAGASLNGASAAAKVTLLTPLADLRSGSGIDTSGLTITNGTATATVLLTSPPLNSPATVEDLLNAVNGSGTDVKAQINAAGTGIDIINPNQGVTMTIGENGGTTAADLGVRSLSGATSLSSLNNGKGVYTVDGEDLQIARTDGTTFNIDLSSLATVQDVINAINSADTSGGSTPSRVVAALATTGSGITLTDSAGGSGPLTVTALNASGAAADLGLTALASAGGAVIAGTDTAAVSAMGIFANLAALRDSLKNSDQPGITTAATGLREDSDRVIRTRGENGAHVQELESRQNRLEDQNTATQSLLSNLADTNYTDAIAKFQTLQTALQATLETAGKTMSLSLLDFLE